jgi:BTB/POZ domain
LNDFQAEADLLLVASETRSQSHITPTGEASPTADNLNLRETDVILQSSDGANFRVHKVILATSSPFFGDLFSLAQPSDDEVVDGFPVVRLPEDAEVLHSLVTILYPVPSILPDSYDKVLDLLSASQKYDMVAVQSSIRTEVSQKTFPMLMGTGVFRAYAIASSKRLTPEIINAARLTLDYPMTFECIGDELGLFDGWALRDLARFRRRCRDSIVSCLVAFLHCDDALSKIWDGCPQPKPKEPLPTIRLRGRNPAILAGWLHDLIARNVRDLQNSFTRPLLDQYNFRKQYLIALQAHIKDTTCVFCLRQYIMEGESYLEQVQNELTSARHEVGTPIFSPISSRILVGFNLYTL